MVAAVVVATVDEFPLEGGQERLGYGVVLTHPGPSHTRRHLCPQSGQQDYDRVEATSTTRAPIVSATTPTTRVWRLPNRTCTTSEPIGRTLSPPRPRVSAKPPKQRTYPDSHHFTGRLRPDKEVTAATIVVECQPQVTIGSPRASPVSTAKPLSALFRLHRMVIPETTLHNADCDVNHARSPVCCDQTEDNPCEPPARRSARP